MKTYFKLPLVIQKLNVNKNQYKKSCVKTESRLRHQQNKKKKLKSKNNGDVANKLK